MTTFDDNARTSIIRLLLAQDDASGANDSVALNELLRSTPSARAAYLAHIQLLGDLYWDFVIGDHTASPAPTKLAAGTTPPPALRNVSLWRMRTWRSGQVLALAVSVLLIGYFASLAGLLIWNRRPSSPFPQSLARQAEGEMPAVTLVEGDATWVQPTKLQVNRGLAKLQFRTGASVVLKAPAVLDVASDNRGYLRQGMLVATVPPAAIGFTIDTDNATIVDRGTEFGVAVEANGETNVEVLAGKVELIAHEFKAPKNNETQPLVLTRGMAGRVASSSRDVPPLATIVATPSKRFAWKGQLRGRNELRVEGVVASSSHQPCDVRHLIDGSGLDGMHHSASEFDMWMSSVGKWKQEFVLFDLRHVHRLDSMAVWNFNFGDGLNQSRGVKRANIFVSLNGRWDPLKSPKDWTLVAENVAFNAAPGTPEYATPDVVPLHHVRARFVAIVVEEKFGVDPRGEECVGLSEVKFIGEPAEGSSPVRQ